MRGNPDVKGHIQYTAKQRKTSIVGMAARELTKCERTLETLVKRFLSLPEASGPYVFGPDGAVRLHLPNNVRVTLTGATWKNLKRVISTMNDNVAGDACAICFEEYEDAEQVISFCNQCGKPTCGKCYYDLFVQGYGVIVCPFCRFETGWRSRSDAQFEASKKELRARCFLHT